MIQSSRLALAEGQAAIFGPGSCAAVKGRTNRLEAQGVRFSKAAYATCAVHRVEGFEMSNASRLLVVDDDQDLRDTLAEQLGFYDEFQVATAETATGAIDAVKGDRIDLAIMDVGLPDMDGREAVKVMRQNGFRSPIIMLTAQGSEADTVMGLEAGANDYVVKPFKFAVLLARIRAQLRQYEASEDAVFQIGPYIFRPGSKLLTTDKGSKLKLTEKETAILRYLYRAGQAVVGRDTLLTEVWGYNSNVTTHTLETHIYRLRQKIETDPSNASILVTEPGGYKLIP
jgi:DNA-binding response OmpR family regulator